MTIEELYDEIAKDFTIDESELGHESARSSTLFIKYIQMYSNEKLKVDILNKKRSELILEKREYYQGNAPAEVYKEKPFDVRIRTDAQLDRYINADSDVIAYDTKILIQKQKVEVLSECLDEIKRRGYAIKAAIDYQKFINGG